VLLVRSTRNGQNRLLAEILDEIKQDPTYSFRVQSHEVCCRARRGRLDYSRSGSAARPSKGLCLRPGRVLDAILHDPVARDRRGQSSRPPVTLPAVLLTTAFAPAWVVVGRASTDGTRWCTLRLRPIKFELRRGLRMTDLRGMSAPSPSRLLGGIRVQASVHTTPRRSPRVPLRSGARPSFRSGPQHLPPASPTSQRWSIKPWPESRTTVFDSASPSK